jgi:hypothetical protein
VEVMPEPSLALAAIRRERGSEFNTSSFNQVAPRPNTLNVSYWPKADILIALANVRFRGGKADIE